MVFKKYLSFNRNITLFLLLIMFFIVVKNVSANAFPGAEGFGAETRGAYAGSSTPEIIHVTNLNDSGQGSLRNALLTAGPRVIVFDVGGTIQLNSNIEMNSSNSNLTLAGQTAPGDGINLRGGALDIKGQSNNNIIIRGIRIRPDNGPGHSPCDKRRAIDFNNVNNFIIANSSFSWTTDEALTLWGYNKNITIQNNLVSRI